MMISSLIVELEEMLSASSQITEDDLKTLGVGATANKKLVNNPLRATFLALSEILIQRSEEAILREAERSKEAREGKAARKIQTSTPKNKDPVPIQMQSVAGPRAPNTGSSTPQKRNFSDTSFGTRSTETTPTKLVKPEPSIQDLQGVLVRDVLNALYVIPRVPVPWARGRTNMFLSYESWVALCNPFDSRSCSTSFRCRYPDNRTEMLDSVTAIADGCLKIVTDKASNPGNFSIWSRQHACLLFEVCFHSLTPDNSANGCMPPLNKLPAQVKLI